jgi:hypothetical protein
MFKKTPYPRYRLFSSQRHHRIKYSRPLHGSDEGNPEEGKNIAGFESG